MSAAHTEADQVPPFAGLSVAVVGDLIADFDVLTEPRGLSREAPVMVLRHLDESVGAGGAANVARNLRALGARTSVLGAVGRDPRGRELLQILDDEEIDASGVVTVAGWTTPTKTRVFAAEPRRSRQQVLRIDREPREPVGELLRRSIADRVRELGATVDALVISDYEYGLVDGILAAAVCELCQAGTICVLDPRRPVKGFDGVTAWTPNVGELARLVGVDVDELEDLGQLGAQARRLRSELDTHYLLVTRGNRGMALYGAGLPHEGLAVEASGQGDVTDVSGAGDTAAAVFALALAAGREPAESMRLANAASGVVVMQSGAAVCTRAELERALVDAPRPRGASEVLSG